MVPGLPSGLPGGVGTVPATPPPAGISTNTPGPMAPGAGIPGTIPGGIPGTVPGGIPGTIPGGIPGTVPGGIPGTVPGGIPGAPNVNPTTGIPMTGTNGIPPIGGLPNPGTNVSTNQVPQLTPEEIAAQMREAIKVFIQEARTIQRDARSGNPRQQHNLAVLYTLGVGVPLDFKRAHYWFNQSAKRGLPEAQFNLGIAYQGGMGVQKDFVTAYKFYTLAAMEGLPNAGAARDNIAQYMTRLQIESAQRMARGFQQQIERRFVLKELEDDLSARERRVLGLGDDDE